MIQSIGYTDKCMTDTEIEKTINDALTALPLDTKKVLILTPDATRTAPIPHLFRLFCKNLISRVAQLDFMVALGTHQPMTISQLDALFGLAPDEKENDFPRVNIYNHEWDNPDILTTIGTITAKEISGITNGLFNEAVEVTLNKRIFDYDHILIIGPTFPHEVVGFSGGNKYFFPGIAAAPIINFTHWLGALITNPKINGTKATPVRDVINRAAAFIDKPKTCFSLVTTHDGLHGIYVDTPENAYSAAADLSAQIHIRYVDKKYKRVLAICPHMYEDIWTAGKCMYKLEPIVADGGELIIYAPHITDVSYTHGDILDKIGYHVRDYFTAQPERFKDVSRGVMAHSTHVRGIGTYKDGIEKPRVTVTLATQIPEAYCKKISLNYVDHKSIDPAAWQGREEEGLFVVHNAGEVLHKVKQG